MKRKVVITEDGSSSLFVESIQEHFHSHFGAIQEANHIFIEYGLKSLLQSHKATINILEIGFGTGLNCLLTLHELKDNFTQIYYEGIEKYPLTDQEFSMLNYSNLIQSNSDADFQNIHKADWNKTVDVSPNFYLHKRVVDFEKATFEAEKFDLVYFDPFSPEKQPEMWQMEPITSVFNAMKTDAVLLTYCTKGVVKRTLKEVGFTIEKLPGPIGKREILKATKL